MEPEDIAAAAALLADAHRTGGHIDALPATSIPSTTVEAHAIQDAVVKLLGEPVVGWKISGTSSDKAAHGAILSSRMLSSPATLSSSLVPLMGVEAEVAFRALHDVPPRDTPYERAEIRKSFVAFAAIEVVDSRFTSYSGTPVLHRLCDLMSNGGLIHDEPNKGWLRLDLNTIDVKLEVDGQTVVKSRGGHADGDPLLPVIAFANAHGVQAGQVVTSGTFTGLTFAKPGETVRCSFEGLGSVAVTFS
jgi:2-keto-4-pentenoate hydratase